MMSIRKEVMDDRIVMGEVSFLGSSREGFLKEMPFEQRLKERGGVDR